MNRMDYGRSVVTVRVLEKKLLTKNKLDRMIDAETPEEVLKLLGDTEYSQNMSDIQNAQDYEVILKREKRDIEGIGEDLLGRDIERRLADIQNLRRSREVSTKGSNRSVYIMAVIIAIAFVVSGILRLLISL